MIKVSVIVPVFNVEKYLADCLESIIGQELKEIEIICVNDGSTDNSLNILNEYANRDNRIKVINNKNNSGLSYARNRGMELANGEYIYFLDSDDMITKEAMEELYFIAKEKKLDVIFFDARIIFENKLLIEKCFEMSERQKKYSGILKGEQLFAKFIENEEWMAQVQRQFWSRKYLLENKLTFYEGIIHEDEIFSFLALLKAERAFCINKKYFIRRYRENSIMTRNVSQKNLEGVFISYCEVLAFWQSHKFKDDVNDAIELYSLTLYRRAKNIYIKILNEKIKINLEHNNVFLNQLFKLFIAGVEKPIIYNKIGEDKLKKIKSFPNVIIYGAGTIAREILEVIDDNEIGILGFAVSDKKNNPKYIMGIPVYSIEELEKYCDNSIVLVSVIPKYQKDIINRLNELRFGNILLMI
ncbi:glycosyltransferase [Clostridium sp. BL-8]|uniref:glycosyltransferase n=1 Tax=Clostridium sp. BL-8 TaxID=349938 RepID=UPI00098CEFDD|nr:glycosyltransferase [Clostridium sp. BL-8]OOM79959.1 putative glycosyltransferase EpsJ [Clostridium sp. BL-8]